jgi:hypothetical protein
MPRERHFRTGDEKTFNLPLLGVKSRLIKHFAALRRAF